MGKLKIDDIIHPSDVDHTAAFLFASTFAEIELSNRAYVMNGQIDIKSGQIWHMNGAQISHSDSSKVMFSAVGVDGWALLNKGVLQGTLTARGSAAETGLYIQGCNRYFVDKIAAQLFLGYGIHIAAGSLVRYKTDQGKFSDCAAYECMNGLQVDVGTGGEYNTFTNFHAVGNINGVSIAAGNTSIIGGNLCENDTGLILLGGSNNGHGIIQGVNINHNPIQSVQVTDVTNGFTLADCHIYGNGSGTSPINISGASTDVCFDNCVIDAAVVHNASGTNRIANSKRFANFSVGGSNPVGLIQANNY